MRWMYATSLILSRFSPLFHNPTSNQEKKKEEEIITLDFQNARYHSFLSLFLIQKEKNKKTLQKVLMEGSKV